MKHKVMICFLNGNNFNVISVRNIIQFFNVKLKILCIILALKAIRAICSCSKRNCYLCITYTVQRNKIIEGNP